MKKSKPRSTDSQIGSPINTMTVAVARKPGSPLALEARPVPTPGPGQILIRVKACGVCHSDLHIVDGDWDFVPMPRVPGHEAVGVVAATGADVSRLKVGDRVGMPWVYSSCGTCRLCLAGEESLCPAHDSTGVTVDGGYAEFLVAPENHATRIPDEISFEMAAPLFCAGLTVYKAVKVAAVRPGELVAVQGIGGLGHLAIQAAKIWGARVVALTRSAERAEIAETLGADDVVVGSFEAQGKAMVKMGGADVILQTGSGQDAARALIPALADRGRFLLLSGGPGQVSITPFDLIGKRAAIFGSAVGNRSDLIETLAWGAAGRLRSIIETYPLRNVNEALDRLRLGKVQIRAVLTM